MPDYAAGLMTAFSPIPPRRAIEHLELAGIPHAQEFMVNFAIGGLLRTYARVTETIHTAGRRVVVRDAMIPAELWRRIEAEGKVNGACGTDTARLDGSPHHGTPTVSLIGIRINEDDVLATARQHGALLAEPEASISVVPARPPRNPRPSPAAADQLTLPPILMEADPASHAAVPEPRSTCAVTRENAPKHAPKNDVPNPNALWITVTQTMTLTNLGRTKINDLMIAGSFRRKKVDRRTLIERASIDEYMASR